MRPPRGREADAVEDLRDPLPGLAGRQPVEPRRVGEVLDRGHFLEERRLDRYAVDQPPDGSRLRDVVAEDARAAAVRQEQRRQQADERRLPGAVLTEHGDAL